MAAGHAIDASDRITRDLCNEHIRTPREAWVKAAHVTNVRAPIILDASQSSWPIASADGIICINMVHISPWEGTVGLIKGRPRYFLRRHRSISMARTNAKGSQRLRATKCSTGTFAIATRSGVCETSRGSLR